MTKLEDYGCEHCSNDGFSHMGCGDCPRNDARIREWERKYGDKKPVARVYNGGD